MGRRKKEKGKLVVISGFSGVGKGTVIKYLMKTHPEYVFSVSATTRAPRPGEIDGKDYFFIDPETFDKWVEEGKFLEYAHFFDKAYGTLADHVESLRNQGKTVILDIEVEGASNVRKACPDSLSFYIIPPDAQELVRRIEGRGTETRAQISRRLAKAVREAEVVPSYQYQIINDKVEDAAAEIDRLVHGKGLPRVEKEAALARTAQIQENLREILKDYELRDTITDCIQDSKEIK